ncbi:MAG: addiction module protein [Gemmataceae bacterium]
MSDRASTLLAQVLELNATERAELIDRVAESLDPPESLDELTPDDLTAECNRRAAEMRADPSAGVPWEQVREMR